MCLNEKRRGRLREAINLLNRVASILDQAHEGELDCMANMPENLENSERYTSMEDAADSIADAMNSVSEAMSDIEQAIKK